MRTLTPYTKNAPTSANSLTILLLVTTLLCLIPILNYAQNLSPCELKLEKALGHFEEGKIELVPNIIAECLDNPDLEFEKNVAAHKLLAETYIYLSKDREADLVLQRLLKLDPAFGTNTTVLSPELVERLRTFRTTPSLGIGFNFGTVATTTHTSQYYHTDLQNDSTAGKPTNKPLLGLRIGSDVEVMLGKNFEFSTGLDFVWRRFRYKDELVHHLDSTDLNGYDNLEFNENHYSLDVPILLRYNRQIKQFHPYAYLGVHGNFLLGANMSKMKRSSGNENVFEQVVFIFSHFNNSSEEQKTPNLRLFSNLSLTAGLGLKIPFKLDHLIIDLQYNYQVFNAVKRQNRYLNPQLLYEFAYVDNDFRVSNLSLTFGYSKSIFMPKKKRGEAQLPRLRKSKLKLPSLKEKMPKLPKPPKPPKVPKIPKVPEAPKL